MSDYGILSHDDTATDATLLALSVPRWLATFTDIEDISVAAAPRITTVASSVCLLPPLLVVQRALLELRSAGAGCAERLNLVNEDGSRPKPQLCARYAEDGRSSGDERSKVASYRYGYHTG
ncbi:hypothetical protein J6590_034265 [Homalodisca vitripennis]|nr:hypothetical protein J6590_034265 [Homalodisca vitripennis]